MQLSFFFIYITNLATLENKIENFWKIEERGYMNTYTREESDCEKHFKDTFLRDETGRFIVELPMRENTLVDLHETKGIAVKRLLNMEAKLAKNVSLKFDYYDFHLQY